MEIKFQVIYIIIREKDGMWAVTREYIKLKSGEYVKKKGSILVSSLTIYPPISKCVSNLNRINLKRCRSGMAFYFTTDLQWRPKKKKVSSQPTISGWAS